MKNSDDDRPENIEPRTTIIKINNHMENEEKKLLRNYR